MQHFHQPIDFTIADFSLTESPTILPSSPFVEGQPAHSPTHHNVPNREPLPAIISNAFDSEGDNSNMSSSSAVAGGGIFGIYIVVILLLLMITGAMNVRRRRRRGKGGIKNEQAVFQRTFQQAEEQDIAGQHQNLNYCEHNSSTSSASYFQNALDDVNLLSLIIFVMNLVWSKVPQVPPEVVPEVSVGL